MMALRVAHCLHQHILVEAGIKRHNLRELDSKAAFKFNYTHQLNIIIRGK